MKTYIGKYDAKIYPREALLKASYQFINDYYVHLKMDGDSYAVEFAPKEEADKLLETLRAGKYTANAAVIGEITEENAGKVVLTTEIGSETLLPQPGGELLPRIC